MDDPTQDPRYTDWVHDLTVNYDGGHVPHTEVDFPALREAGARPEDLNDFMRVIRAYTEWLREQPPHEIALGWFVKRDHPTAGGAPLALDQERLSHPDLTAMILVSGGNSLTIRIMTGRLESSQDLVYFPSRGVFELQRIEWLAMRLNVSFDVHVLQRTAQAVP
jgi:hypothetical protein